MVELKKLLYKLNFKFYKGDNAQYSTYRLYNDNNELLYQVLFQEKEFIENRLLGNNIILGDKKKSVSLYFNKDDIIKYFKEEFNHILRKDKIELLLNDKTS